MKIVAAILLGLVGMELSLGQGTVRPFPEAIKDPLRHPDGLSYIMFERVGFNTFLGGLTPSLQREQNLNEEVVTKIRELSRQRYHSQTELLSELKKKWDSASEHERIELANLLVKRDDQLVQQQLEALNELLVPVKQRALIGEYLRSGNPRLLFDPSVAMWLELDSQELAAMRRFLDEAQAFLQRARINTPDRYQSLPQDLDAEYRRICERIWKPLSEEKIVRCFRAFGFIGPEEGLADFLRRFPERGEFLIEEVPVFSVTKLRLEADRNIKR